MQAKAARKAAQRRIELASTAPSAPIGSNSPPQPSASRPFRGTFTRLATKMITIEVRGRPLASRKKLATMYMSSPGSPKANACDTSAAPRATLGDWPMPRNISSAQIEASPASTPSSAA